MKKIKPNRNNQYYLLINYIPETMKKSVDKKNRIVSLFKINKPKQTVFGRGKKLSKPRMQN